MHMQNELLSPPVAAGTCAIAAAAIGFICRRASKLITSENMAMMGLLGAFIFAAQMVNFQLPIMPGTSGHITGAVLLAIVLGPYAASIVLTSVVIIQCLIFQDGGLLAIGCNIINIAIVPSFVGFAIYSLLNKKIQTKLATITACIAAMLSGSALVAIQAAISGVLQVPLATFMLTMLATHLIIGTIEGLITAFVLQYLRQARPEIITGLKTAEARITKQALYFTLIFATITTGAILSLFASDNPDGLEWSYSHRPDQPEFKSIVSNDSQLVTLTDNLHAKIAPLPDYTINSANPTAAWTSFAAVTGSAAVMALIFLSSRLITRKSAGQNAPCPD